MKYATLTETAVLQARELFAGGLWSIFDLAGQFAVHPQTMEDAILGVTWANTPFFARVICQYCKKQIGVKGGFTRFDDTHSICDPCMEIHHPKKEIVNA